MSQRGMNDGYSGGGGGWGPDDARTFIEYGRYFIPERETQIETICKMIPAREDAFHVLDLCCGEGLLSAAVLDRFPTAVVHGYDGSSEMLAAAHARLAGYGERFDTRQIDLASDEWRRPPWPLHALVSSLAIHHLSGEEKRRLFRDVFDMLETSGVFLIADIVTPATARGVELAADAWDDAVRRRALELEGTAEAFEVFQDERWNHYRYPDPIDTPSPLFDQLRWLTEAGFSAVDVFWMQAGHAVFGGEKR